MIITWWLIFIAVISGLLYVRASLPVFSVGTAALLILFSFLGHSVVEVKFILWVVWLAAIFPFNFLVLRRNLVTRRIFKIYKKIMPKVSSTEKEALEAGDVCWEGELFQGKPQWDKLFSIPKPTLTAEEQAFIRGPLEELCGMINDWQITHVDGDMSPEMWQFIKDKGFFGLVVPKKYGGLAISATAHSAIVTKLYTASVTVAVNVAVPNSLGPAELLMHYGTDKQRDYYLPRLARGEDIPCFALTSPDAGSDATSMTDYGIVCKQEFEGKEVLGMRLNWNKRYITMCPVATILGLAFKLYDPDKLLGDKEELGITCALIPMKTKGVVHGRRHYPAGAVFQNGPTTGKDVFVPLDYIIGGKDMIGHGWRMLVDCLSVGRAISLPASGVACTQFTAISTGAYARVRKQFGLSVGRFEGVEEKLAQIGGLTYEAIALNELTLTMVDTGNKPAICSAISKYHCTELGRRTLLNSMDIHSGKGVMLGPKNYVGRGYQEIPIAITVEGANILTRSMIIFGQGAFRCHPYAHAEWEAGMMTNKTEALKKFDKAVFGHIGFTVSNFVRAFWLGLTNGRFVFTGKHKNKRYLQKFTRYSAALALSSDMSMTLLGGALKRKERVSARLGDILSDLFTASGVLKRYIDNGADKQEKPLLDWACKDLIHHIELSFDELFRNYPIKWAGLMLRFLVFPAGRRAKKPTDRLDHKVADLLMHPNAARSRLAENVYFGDLKKPNHLLALNEEALRHVIEVEALEKQLRKAYKKRELVEKTFVGRVEEALKKKLISQDDQKKLLKADELRQRVLAVDDFSPEDLRHGEFK